MRSPRHPRPPLPARRPATQLVAPVALRPQPARLGRAHERRVGERRGTCAWAWAWAWVRVAYARALFQPRGTGVLEPSRTGQHPDSNPCLAPRRPSCARALTRASPNHAPPCFEPLHLPSISPLSPVYLPHTPVLRAALDHVAAHALRDQQLEQPHERGLARVGVRARARAGVGVRVRVRVRVRIACAAAASALAASVRSAAICS